MTVLSGFLTDLNRRLIRPDLIQLMTLAFGVLLFALLTSWPVAQTEPNNSWFVMVQTRLVLFAVLAAGYGSTSTRGSLKQARYTLFALVIFALLSSPFDIASYAASYPSAPLWWSLMIIPLDTIGFFGLGLALGQVSSMLRIRSLLPITVPALIIGAIAVDSFLNINFVSPLSVAIQPLPLHLGFMLALVMLTLFYLLRTRASEDNL